MCEVQDICVANLLGLSFYKLVQGNSNLNDIWET